MEIINNLPKQEILPTESLRAGLPKTIGTVLPKNADLLEGHNSAFYTDQIDGINASLTIESGTFTPTFAGLTIAGTPTYGGNNSGRYYKIGKMCYILAIVSITSKGGATGRLSIGGLPFASATTSSNQPLTKTLLIGVTYGSYLEANFFIPSNDNTILAVWQNGTSVSQLDTSSCAETTTIQVGGVYIIA